MVEVFDPATPATAPSRPVPARAGARPALMVTWAVSDAFGGMTAMCLKRASLFHERGTPSAVVSFDAAPRFGSIHSALVATNKLHPGVPIINLHEYYASVVDDSKSLQMHPQEHTAVDWNHHSTTKRESDDSLFHVDHSSRANEKLSHREYFRRDGSIYLTDSTLPLGNDPKKTHRVLHLLDSLGRVRGTFVSASELYRFWLSELVGETPTDVIVDSKFSAGFLCSFEHPLAVKFFNFHSTHVAAGAPALTGKLSDSHQAVISHRESWDGITFLTRSQRHAFVERFGDQGNTFVISNPVDGPTEFPDFSKRDRSRVLHVGRFTKGKNISEVIKIVHGVATGGTPVSLDLIGDGEQRPELEQLVRDLAMEDLVRFRGHINTVPEELATASLLLLCSKFEGQSLAILEAQAAGCVPVSYDVDFGPRDVIRHGSTGYLVPFNDREAAIGAVTRLLVDDALCKEMSLNAFELAKDYTSDAIFGQWIRALDAARANQSTRMAMTGLNASLSAIFFRPDGMLEIALDVESAELELEGLELVITERGNPDTASVRCLPYREEQGGFRFLIPTDLRTTLPGSGPLDLNIHFEAGGVVRIVRLGVNRKLAAFPFMTAYGNLSFK